MDGVDPIEQIAAEPILVDELLKIAIGGAGQLQAYGNPLLAAHADDFALLDRAQELRLHARRHLPHFVEAQCAAFGLLEHAAAFAKLRR